MNPPPERLLNRVREVVSDTAGGLAVDFVPLGFSGPWMLWTRYVSVSSRARAWPAGPPVAGVGVIRFNRVREANDLSVAAACVSLAPGARLVVFGENDDGIRAFRTAAGVSFETVDAIGHGRVLVGQAPDRAARTLADFRRMGTMALPSAGTRPWVSYPGCFAKGGLDAGTSVLLASFQQHERSPARVLDHACGTGVIAGDLSARWPGAAMTCLENDAIALEAARENVERAVPVLGAALGAVGAERFDLIVSNPPFHQGRRRDDSVWQALVREAPAHLEPGGELRVVVQREVRVEAALGAAFARVERLAVSGGYEVWRGSVP